MSFSYEKKRPPSTRSGVFVMNEDSSDTKNKIALAQSSGVPAWPIGCALANHSRVASGSGLVSMKALDMDVKMFPGTMVLARMASNTSSAPVTLRLATTTTCSCQV